MFVVCFSSIALIQTYSVSESRQCVCGECGKPCEFCAVPQESSSPAAPSSSWGTRASLVVEDVAGGSKPSPSRRWTTAGPSVSRSWWSLQTDPSTCLTTQKTHWQHCSRDNISMINSGKIHTQSLIVLCVKRMKWRRWNYNLFIATSATAI